MFSLTILEKTLSIVGWRQATSHSKSQKPYKGHGLLQHLSKCDPRTFLIWKPLGETEETVPWAEVVLHLHASDQNSI